MKSVLNHFAREKELVETLCTEYAFLNGRRRKKVEMAIKKEPGGRPGRREKADGKPKTGSITFRVRPDMKANLEESAAARFLSMSEEVERRCLLSFDLASNPSNEFIVRTVANALRLSEMVTGKTWTTDKITATMACAAMQAAAAIITAHHEVAGLDEHYVALAEKAGIVQAVRAAALYSGMPIEKLLQLGKDDIEAFFGAQAIRETVPPQTLARLLREDSPARPATPEEVAGMADAPGLLPPSLNDQSAFDDAVSGLPLVQAERAEKPAPKRRSQTKAGV